MKFKPPKPSKELLQKSEDIQKKLNKLKGKQYDKEFTKEEQFILNKYSLPKSKTIYFFIGIILNILISFVFIAVILVNFFMFHKPFTFLTILIMLLAIPLHIASIIILFVMLFWKRKKIKSKITLVLSKNYVIAEFFTSAKRKTRAIVPINSDGISFSIGKRDYIVDKEEIWYDFKKRPVSHYLPELPNPLKFNFEKNIKEHLKKLKAIKSGADVIHIIENDIAFSSTNLQLYKKDKVFSDLNKLEGSVDQKTFTTIMVFAGIVIFVFLIISIIGIVT